METQDGWDGCRAMNLLSPEEVRAMFPLTEVHDFVRGLSEKFAKPLQSKTDETDK